MLKKLGALAAAVAMLAVPAAGAEEKKLSIFIAYTGVDGILQEFTKDTGIQVEYLAMSSGEVLTRLRAAKGKAQADVWFGGGLDSYVAAVPEWSRSRTRMENTSTSLIWQTCRRQRYMYMVESCI